MTRAAGILFGALLLAPLRNTVQVQQEAPLFNLVEELRITSDESSKEKSLTTVSALTVLSDGSIVTFHGRRISWDLGGMVIRGTGGTTVEQIMRIYDATGKFVRVIGGPGAGPGEFRGMAQAGSVGDDIWASDYMSSRETVLSRDGKFVATSSHPVISPGTGATSRVLGMLPQNRRLITQRFATPTPTDYSPTPDSVIYSIVDSSGQRVSRIAADPTYKHKTIRAVIGGMNWRNPQQFAGTVLAAVSDGAERAVVASDAEVWGGRPGQIRLQIIGSDGRMTQQDVSLPALRIPADYIDTFANRMPAAEARAQTKAALQQQLYLPEYYPVLGAMKVGRDGAVWISPVYEPDVWRVIVDGRAQMRVRVPARTQVMAVSRTKVWAVGETSDGVPIILRYAVVR